MEEGDSMRNLYRKCFERDNILEAMRIVKGHQGSKTAGPDGINRLNLENAEKVIKEVKARLRRYKKVNSRKVEIPKSNGKVRELTIINLYDRIAQQAVYQIIQPILEKKMSEHSYGFRSGISAKIPVSRIAIQLNNLKSEYYTVEIDFTKCFDNVPLDKALRKMYEMGIKDGLLLKTIKHLMWTSKEYNGIGLGQGTILGPIMANCYLDKLDRFIENEFETVERKTQYNVAHEKHKLEWIAWMQRRGWKIHCRYYRYADDSIIICRDKEEQRIIYGRVKEFVETEMDISINEEKTKLGCNDTVNFLGFAITKTDSISIGVKAEKEVLKGLRNFKLRNHEELLEFLRYVNGLLNYYDICNNMKGFISRIIDRIWYRNNRTEILEKVEGKQIYIEKGKSFEGKKRKQIILDIWEMRRMSKMSIKDYIMGSKWISKREDIKRIKTWNNEFTTYAWMLYTKQKGKDKVTGKELNIENMVIHHVRPIEKGGNNDSRNLILINWWTHELIHGKMPVTNPKVKWYRNQAQK